MDKNIFDLDFQVNKINNNENVPQRIESLALCTPGTCHKGCKFSIETINANMPTK